MLTTKKTNAAAETNEEGRPTTGDDALGGVIFSLDGGETTIDKAETEEPTLPQLAASSSSGGGTYKSNGTNGTSGSWLERLACAVDVDYHACGVAKGGEPIAARHEEFAKVTKDASVATEAKRGEAGQCGDDKDQPQTRWLAKGRGGALLQKMDREIEKQREALANDGAHLFDAVATLSILQASEKAVQREHTVPGSPIVLPVRDVAALLDLLRQRRASGAPSLRAVRLVLGSHEWRAALSALSPDEYAALIVASVDSEFDRPDVAALAARRVDERLFAHEHVLAALDVVADHGKAKLVARLMPLCVDGDSKEARERVRARLSEWQVECAGLNTLGS